MSVELHAGDLLCAARMPEANECLQIPARAVPLADMATSQAQSADGTRLSSERDYPWPIVMRGDREAKENLWRGLSSRTNKTRDFIHEGDGYV